MRGWPQSLRIAVGICLNSRFPMFVWWGPSSSTSTTTRYIPILGKRHPARSAGRRATVWAEIWDVVGPQAEAVMQRGEATWNERVLLVMERHGYTEDTYFTWSYSPIPDDDGRHRRGVLRVHRGDRARRAPSASATACCEQLAARSAQRLTEAFRQSPSFLAILRGPRHVFEFVQRALLPADRRAATWSASRCAKRCRRSRARVSSSCSTACTRPASPSSAATCASWLRAPARTAGRDVRRLRLPADARRPTARSRACSPTAST